MLDLELESPPAGQAYLDDLGTQAIAAIQAWDGSDDSTLPTIVTDRLYEAASAVPQDVRLWIGGPEASRRVEVKRRDRGASRRPRDEEALLRGWLREVNWDRRTAQLHDYAGGYVSLRFDDALDDEMLRLATQYVEVRGTGRFNKDDEWATVHVEQLNETRSWSEPFDLDAFLDDPTRRSSTRRSSSRSTFRTRSGRHSTAQSARAVRLDADRRLPCRARHLGGLAAPGQFRRGRVLQK